MTVFGCGSIFVTGIISLQWMSCFLHPCIKYIYIYLLSLFQEKALKGLTKPRFYGEKNNWYWLAVGATLLEGLLKPQSTVQNDTESIMYSLDCPILTIPVFEMSSWLCLWFSGALLYLVISNSKEHLIS